MNTPELREKFLQYFVQHNHQLVASSSLVPSDDPTLLFVNAGMVQFKSFFQGLMQPPFLTATTSQRCVRAGGKHNDLSQVGKTSRHHTFFEMLGSFSFGDYFKEKAIVLAWNFLTQELNLPEEKLWVTVFADDDESFTIWRDVVGLTENKIIRIGAEDNFWSMGDTGPCGPCTEIFYDHGESVAGGLPGSDNADGDRYVEIWNLVFMQYDMQPDGSKIPLPKPCVDTGMGLERIAAIMQGVTSNYSIDVFAHLIEALKKRFLGYSMTEVGFRVIADHLRAMIFLIGDDVLPSNDGRGYVLRRIIRRAIRYAYQAGLREEFLSEFVEPCLVFMGGDKVFPQAWQMRSKIKEVIVKESKQFNQTIHQGMGLLERYVANNSGCDIDADLAFKLHDTHGFPLDLTEDFASEHNLLVDVEGFELNMQKQKDRGRSANKFKTDINLPTLQEATEFVGEECLDIKTRIVEMFADNKSVNQVKNGTNAVLILEKTNFYAESGGQVGDTGIIQTSKGVFVVENTRYLGKVILHYGIVKSGDLSVTDKVQAIVDPKRLDIMANHTATHLLHAALRQVLGDSVVQKGSLVEHNRLRFDFAFERSLTPKELSAVEGQVNQWIFADIPGRVEVMSIEQARNSGALALFDGKYSDNVRVVSYGDISKELCGGTHLNSTSNIGTMVLFKDVAIASGVRRVEAITRNYAYAYNNNLRNIMDLASQELNVQNDKIIATIQKQKQSILHLQEQSQLLQKQSIMTQINDWIESYMVQDNFIIFKVVDIADMQLMRDIADTIQNKCQSYAYVIVGSGDKLPLVCGVSKNLHAKLDAKQILAYMQQHVDCKAGGRVDFVQGACRDMKILSMQEMMQSWLRDRLN